MFYEGQLIETDKIHANVRKQTAATLRVPEEAIEYVFVEYDGDACVISAETDRSYAILRTSVDNLDHSEEYREEAEWLIDDLIRESFIDYALDTGNEELFRAVLEYRKTGKTADPHLPSDVEYEEIGDLQDIPFLYGGEIDPEEGPYWTFFDED